MIDKLVIGFRNGQRITVKVGPPDGAARIVRELGELVQKSPNSPRHILVLPNDGVWVTVSEIDFVLPASTLDEGQS